VDARRKREPDRSERDQRWRAEPTHTDGSQSGRARASRRSLGRRPARRRLGRRLFRRRPAA
jgi:hypothetical protein